MKDICKEDCEMTKRTWVFPSFDQQSLKDALGTQSQSGTDGTTYS